MAGTGTRRGRPAKPTQAQNLLEALAFVSVGTGEIEDWHQFVRLEGKQIVAFNGQVAAGHPIAEELTLRPRHDKLEAALKRVGKSLVISETPNGQLSIKGDKLRALVPCLSADIHLATPAPDPNIAPVTEQLKEAFKVCGILASEGAEKAHYASLLLEAYICTGTNGAAVLQYYHGIDLPPAMVLPKVFTAAVAKQTKALVGFGFTWGNDGQVGTVTLHFDGGAWIKTQCYQDRWPDVGAVLNVATHPADTLTGLFDAVEAVSKFTDDDWITFGENMVMSHTDQGAGATYEVQGLQGGKRFKGKLIKDVAPYAKTIDLTTFGDRAYFFGGEPLGPNGPVAGTVRGAIVGLAAQVTYRDGFDGQEPAGTIGGAQINGDDGIDDNVPPPEDEDQTTGWGQ